MLTRTVALVVCAVLLAPAAWADQKDSQLGGLFARLKAAPGLPQAQMIEAKIWRIWALHGNAEVDGRMAIGILNMNNGRFEESLAAFDDVVAKAPDFAEGWNKRATVHYLLGDFDASVRDIHRTLELEPRHFGALSGMGLIFDVLGNAEAAIKVWERALEIHPNMPGIRGRMDELKLELTGKPT